MFALMRQGAALLLALGCTTADAASQDSFRIELGLGHVDEGSARFGRYNDLAEQHGYGVLNLDWWRLSQQPDRADLHLAVRRLGLDARGVEITAQRPGVYRVWLSYVELPVYVSEAALTPFLGVGSTALRLPGNWQAAPTTSGFTQLPASLSRYTPRVDRKHLEFGLDRWLSVHWSTDARVSEQRRRGVNILAGVIGNTGGNPRVAFLPAPVDERTRELHLNLHFARGQRQLSIGYLVSLYDNDASALRWQNPFSAINGWHPSAGYPGGEGQLALAPDNQFHQLNMTFVQEWGNGMRLAADLARARGTQDEPFLPYTVNPVLAASITEPLPRDSLRGQVDTRHAQLRLSQRLANGFDWALRWRDDRRDNETPQASFVYLGGDSMLQETSAASSRRRLNEPYSYRQRHFGVDAGYRPNRASRLRFGWQHDETEREHAERLSAREERFELDYRHDLSKQSRLQLSLQQADRDGSTYVGNRPFLAAYTPEFIATVPGGFENHPDLRRFHLADRERRRLGARWVWQQAPGWMVSLQADSQRDDYRASALGLQQADAEILTAHAQYAPATAWSLGIYLVDERHDSDQAGHGFRGGGARLDQVADPANRWEVRLRDHWQTTGLNLSWRPADSALSATLDLLHGEGRSTYDVAAGSGQNASAIPDSRDRLQSARLELAWRANERSEWKLRLWHERYWQDNLLLQAFPPDQLANVLLPGWAEPDYRVNVVTLSWVWSF